MSSQNGYQRMRKAIQSMTLPGIPYLGLFLTDLTFIL